MLLYIYTYYLIYNYHYHYLYYQCYYVYIIIYIPYDICILYIYNILIYHEIVGAQARILCPKSCNESMASQSSASKLAAVRAETTPDGAVSAKSMPCKQCSQRPIPWSRRCLQSWRLMRQSHQSPCQSKSLCNPTDSCSL